MTNGTQTGGQKGSANPVTDSTGKTTKVGTPDSANPVTDDSANPVTDSIGGVNQFASDQVLSRRTAAGK